MTVALQLESGTDVVTRTALGAVRLIDAATGQTVSDGLSVVARVGKQTIAATPSVGGVHLFHRLPGMREATFWDGETQPSPDDYEFNIEVRDLARRFLPTTFNARLPSWPDVSPVCPSINTVWHGVPVYSAPWRSQITGLAMVRGALRVRSTGRPAAWALLRVYRAADAHATAIPLVEGVSAANGDFMLMFPWPKPISAVHGARGPRWEVRIKVWYDLPDQNIAVEDLPDGESKLAALCPILKQAPSKLLANLSSNMELASQVIVPGQTLYLKTAEYGTTGSPLTNYLYLNH